MVPDLTFSKAMARLLLPQKPTNRVDVTLTSEINRLCAEIRGADGDALTRVYDGAHVRPGHGVEASLLTAVTRRDALLGGGAAAAPGRARAHVELVAGRGAEAREAPAGLRGARDVDVAQFSDLVGVVY